MSAAGDPAMTTEFDALFLESAHFTQQKTLIPASQTASIIAAALLIEGVVDRDV
jgi:hypothetical protein